MALSALIASPALAAETANAEIDLGKRQYAELAQMQAIDTRCHWLAPVDRAAVDATAGERRAWLASKGVAIEGLEKSAGTASARAAGVPCTGAGSEGQRRAIGYGAWQMRVTWALSAHALQQAGDTRLDKHAASLGQAMQGLMEKYSSSIERALPGIAEDAARMHALACKGKECPAAEGTDAERAYAAAWTSQAMLYAEALAQARDKVGAPPAE